jgi:hypothetical protein
VRNPVKIAAIISLCHVQQTGKGEKFFLSENAIANSLKIKKEVCLDFFSLFFIQLCFICRPSDYTVSEDAGIESGLLLLRHWQSDGLTTRLYVINNRLDLMHKFFCGIMRPTWLNFVPIHRLMLKGIIYTLFILNLGVDRFLYQTALDCSVYTTEYSARPLSHINRFTVTPSTPLPSSTIGQPISQSLILVTSSEDHR